MSPFLLLAQRKKTKPARQCAGQRMAGGEKGTTKSQPDIVILAGNLELLLVARHGSTEAAKLRVRTFRGHPCAWLELGFENGICQMFIPKEHLIVLFDS